MQGEFTITIDMGDLGEIDVMVTFSASPGRPGKTSGPPESCYPDEPDECEFLVFKTVKGADITFLFNDMSDELVERLEDLAWKSFQAQVRSDEEDAARDRYEARQDCEV